MFLPNLLISVTHSFFNIMLSVIPLNKIVGIELQNKVVFKSKEKLLVALRGVNYFTGIKDDPVDSGWWMLDILSLMLYISVSLLISRMKPCMDQVR